MFPIHILGQNNKFNLNNSSRTNPHIPYNKKRIPPRTSQSQIETSRVHKSLNIRQYQMQSTKITPRSISQAKPGSFYPINSKLPITNQNRGYLGNFNNKTTSNFTSYKPHSSNKRPSFHKASPNTKHQYRSQTKNKSRSSSPFKDFIKNDAKQSVRAIQMNKNKQNFITSLQDYVEHICGEKKSYFINLNFDQLPYELLDIKNAKLIESVMVCIYDNLINKESQSQTLIMEYCLIYFNNFEKSRLQVLITHHYLKMFAFKIKPVFVQQRILMYYVYILAKSGAIFKQQFSNSLICSIKNVQEIYTALLMVVIQIHKSQNLNQTFRILRTVAEIQRKIISIQQSLKKISIHDVYPLNQITKHFQSFNHLSHPREQQFLTKTQMNLSWKYLKVPPTPFLTPISPLKTYTLVIDLDQTLVYFNTETNVLKYRPFMDTFLKAAKESNFQIVIFTASSKQYADCLINQIQNTNRIFDYRLYRQHLSLFNGRLIKDITRLGRDISKTIIIDNLKVNFSNCPQNGIEISTWMGSKKDRHMLRLSAKILEIANVKVGDVRQYLSNERNNLLCIAEDEMEQNESSLIVE